MTEIQEIDVRIDPDGKVEIDVRGVSGAKCEAVTAQLEAALGGQVIERRHKDSYFQNELEASHDSRLGQGA